MSLVTEARKRRAVLHMFQREGMDAGGSSIRTRTGVRSPGHRR